MVYFGTFYDVVQRVVVLFLAVDAACEANVVARAADLAWLVEDEVAVLFDIADQV